MNVRMMVVMNENTNENASETIITPTGKSTGIVLECYHQILDSKGRAVGGYATVKASEVDKDTWYVRTYATRQGAQFGAAFPKPTVIKGDHAAAMARARAALLAQGKRYRKAAAAGRL